MPNLTLIEKIKNQQKNDTPLVCLTAYTYPIAHILDNHCDILLVGDSVGMALYGMENTLGVTMDMMIAHAQAVTKAASKACVVVDMPFGTYEKSPNFALKCARQILEETGCDAIKVEGGIEIAETMSHLVINKIPVMAHIGLQPQSVLKDGGYKVKGRTADEADRLIKDALAVQKAGAFAVVIEGTIETTAEKITNQVSIPTIGIGASSSCDGQILVTDDLLGLTTDKLPKFVKKYANLAKQIDTAASNYAADVKSREFPSTRYTYQ